MVQIVPQCDKTGNNLTNTSTILAKSLKRYMSNAYERHVVRHTIKHTCRRLTCDQWQASSTVTFQHLLTEQVPTKTIGQGWLTVKSKRCLMHKNLIETVSIVWTDIIFKTNNRVHTASIVENNWTVANENLIHLTNLKKIRIEKTMFDKQCIQAT